MSLDVNISEPDEFNCMELHNCIESVAELKNLGEFTYHVDIVSGKGENYIANVFRVTIQETESDKNLSVIVKTLVNTNRQELFNELHKREVLAYKEVIDKFVMLQNDIPLENRLVLPECILSSAEKNNEVIILEDLLLSDFIIDSKIVKFEKLDYAQVHLIMTELAKFHGLSFVFERKDENFTSIQNHFDDLIFNDNFLNITNLSKYFIDSFKMSVSLISNVEVRKLLEQKIENMFEVIKTYTKRRKYNVFCHGDCWINNMLFKEGTEKAICFLDFQAMRYASPVTDIFYFLYICTDSEFRSKYFDDLMCAYYESLRAFLRIYEIDACNVYPENEFKNELEEMLPFGLLVALMELRLVTTPEDVISSENITDSDIEKDSKDPGGEIMYTVRVNDVINESIGNGVLNQVFNLIN